MKLSAVCLLVSFTIVAAQYDNPDIFRQRRFYIHRDDGTYEKSVHVTKLLDLIKKHIQHTKAILKDLLRDKLIKLEDVRNHLQDKPKTTRLERRRDNRFGIPDYILMQKSVIPGFKRVSYRKDDPTIGTTTQEPAVYDVAVISITTDVPVLATTIIPMETTTDLVTEALETTTDVPNESTTVSILEPVTDLDTTTIDSLATGESKDDEVGSKPNETEVTTILPVTEEPQESLSTEEISTEVPESSESRSEDDTISETSSEEISIRVPVTENVSKIELYQPKIEEIPNTEAPETTEKVTNTEIRNSPDIPDSIFVV